MQVLSELPHDLQISVLQASDAPLDTILDSLPCSMHVQALRAHYPSITASKSLHMDGATLTSENAAHAFVAAAQLRCLTSLHLSDMHTDAFMQQESERPQAALAGTVPKT